MTGGYALYLGMVWIHIVSAAVWVGGMVFFAVVVIPVLRRPEYSASFAELVHRTGVRFRVLGWVVVGLLVVTGTYLLLYRDIGLTELTSASFYGTSFGRTVGLKILVVTAIVVATGIHDLSMTKRTLALMKERPNDPRSLRMRATARYIGRLTLLFALAAVALGVMIVRGGAPW